MDSQLLKGALTLAILTLCDREERYARDLVVELRGAGLRVSLGTMYPALARLEQHGLLASQLVETTAGPARRYYRPTVDGHAQLAESLTAWRSMSAALDRLLDTNPPVSARTRRRIMTGRSPAVRDEGRRGRPSPNRSRAGT